MGASDDNSVSNQVLLRLVIKGMDPSEVSRLAQETYGQLKAEAAQHIDALTSLYRQSQSAQTDAAKEAAQEKIAAETQALDAVTKLMRQQEVEANKVRNAWHGVMEDLENITTVARGAFDVMNAGWERFKGLAEGITKTTNIYDSLKGSIDAMREATEGEIADIDLISAKNRGFQESLHLTDQQYGAVAAAAHNFAKTIGVENKEALDKLITGLATGRLRTLEMVGVTVDADAANRHYAESIGKAVDQLTDHDKKNALLQESLRAMDRKLVDSGGTVQTFAGQWGHLTAQLTNVWHEAELAMGKFIVALVDDFTIHVPNAFRMFIAAAKDAWVAIQHPIDTISGHVTTPNLDATTAQISQGYKDRAAAETTRQQEPVNAARERLADPNAYSDATTGYGNEKSPTAKTQDDLLGRLFQKGAGSSSGPTYQTGLNPDNDLEVKAAMADQDTGGLEAYIKATEDANAAEETRAVTMARIKGLTLDTGTAYQKLADSLGVEVEALTHEEKMEALSNQQKVKADELAKKLKTESDQRRAELKATKDKAGFLSIFLWGEDGPTQTYKELDEFQQHVVDTTGQISTMLQGSFQQLSSAIGMTLAASIEGAAGHKKSMKEMTHDVLESIAQQALIKAVWEVAEGVASIAMYNFPGAALHFAAAAAYGAVGVAAGLGARATSSSAGPSVSTSHTSSGMSTSQNGNQGASGSRSTTSTGSSGNPVNINMTVLPGGEAEAGRSVMKALTALQNQTGQSVQPLIASG